MVYLHLFCLFTGTACDQNYCEFARIETIQKEHNGRQPLIE